MHRIFIGRVYQLAAILLLSPVLAVLTGESSSAQTANDSSWQSHAEPRLKGIYERGEFRPKSVRPSWLSDSSGFLLDEADPVTQKQTTWFYDALTGVRRSATDDQLVTRTNNERRSAVGDFQVEARGGKLLAINHNNKTEVTLATAADNRQVDFRNPVLSPDGTKVLFVEADYSDVRQKMGLSSRRSLLP